MALFDIIAGKEVRGFAVDAETPEEAEEKAKQQLQEGENIFKIQLAPPSVQT